MPGVQVRQEVRRGVLRGAPAVRAQHALVMAVGVDASGTRLPPEPPLAVESGMLAAPAAFEPFRRPNPDSTATPGERGRRGGSRTVPAGRRGGGGDVGAAGRSRSGRRRRPGRTTRSAPPGRRSTRAPERGRGDGPVGRVVGLEVVGLGHVEHVGHDVRRHRRPWCSARGRSRCRSRRPAAIRSSVAVSSSCRARKFSFALRFG